MSNDDLELREFTDCLDRVRDGCVDAVGELFERYFARSVRHARACLQDGETRLIDEEVAAISALDSLVHRVRSGEYGDLTDQLVLWSLLAKIVHRKVIKYRRKMYGPTRSPGAPILAVDQFRDDSSDRSGPVPLVAAEPSPVAQAIASETLSRLMDHLQSPGAKSVLLLRLEGFSDVEIAERLGRSRTWVQRRHETIRKVADSLLREED